MANEIDNPIGLAAKPAGEPRGKRRVSARGRRAMAQAGAANLARYKAEQAAARANLRTDLESRLDDFEREVLADLGEQPSAAERALVASARASYAAILLASRQLLLAPGRLAKARGLGASLAAHTNSLARTLKVLGLKRRAAEAPTLERVFEEIEREKADGQAA